MTRRAQPSRDERRREATSMARPRRKLQLLIETSPGRRRVLSVTPRIPSFSRSEARSPGSASLNTRFLNRLCLVTLRANHEPQWGITPYAAGSPASEEGHAAEE